MLTPPNDSSDEEMTSNTLKGKFRRAVRTMADQHEDLTIKSEKIVSLEDRESGLTDELNELKLKVKKLQKEKAGLKSGLVRIKQKPASDKETSNIEKIQNDNTTSTIGLNTKIKGLPGLDVIIKTENIDTKGNIEQFKGTMHHEKTRDSFNKRVTKECG